MQTRYLSMFVCCVFVITYNTFSFHIYRRSETIENIAEPRKPRKSTFFSSIITCIGCKINIDRTYLWPYYSFSYFLHFLVVHNWRKRVYTIRIIHYHLKGIDECFFPMRKFSSMINSVYLQKYNHDIAALSHQCIISVLYSNKNNKLCLLFYIKSIYAVK
jgi:hypothetical protein